VEAAHIAKMEKADTFGDATHKMDMAAEQKLTEKRWSTLQSKLLSKWFRRESVN